jgi:HD-GYP domain-containing protein (c-di-GMP phosphodiesterase class II)
VDKSLHTTSDRPYRAARTAEEAVAELRRWAGRQFDPQVVGLLCAVLADQDEPAAELAAG